MRVASTAIGLSRWMGKGRSAPSVTSSCISTIICCARPTANAGMSRTPPRANVRVSAASSCSFTGTAACVRLPYVLSTTR